MRLHNLKTQLLGTEPRDVDLTEEIARMVIEARIAKGLTQFQLAKLAKTKQPSIARIENGSYLPSLRFLEKLARAFKTKLIPPRFAFLEAEKDTLDTSSRENVVDEATQIVTSIENEQRMYGVQSFTPKLIRKSYLLREVGR